MWAMYGGLTETKDANKGYFISMWNKKDYELGIDINNLFVVNDYYGRVRPKDLEILKKR